MNQPKRCTSGLQNGARCGRLTNSANERCFLHSGAGVAYSQMPVKPYSSLALSRAIPRVDGEHLVASAPVSSDSSATSKKRWGLFEFFSKKNSEAALKTEILDLLPDKFDAFEAKRDFSNRLAGVTDLDTLRSIREITSFVFSEDAFESDLVELADLAGSSPATVRNVHAYQLGIHPGEGTIERLTTAHKTLAEDYGFIPDENGIIVSIPAHIRVEDAVNISDPKEDFPSYWETPDLVNAVQNHLEAVDRIEDYMRSNRTASKDRDGNRVNGFSIENLEDYLDISSAVGDGFL